VLTFAAAASYVNHRFFKLPATIGLMALSLAVSLVIVALGTAGVLDGADDVVVAFPVQGLTFGRLIRRSFVDAGSGDAD